MQSRKGSRRPIDPEVVERVEDAGGDPSATLDVLRKLQLERRGLNSEVLADLARVMHVPAEEVYGVASFYSMLSLAPEVAPDVRLCDGVACWLARRDGRSREVDEEIGSGPEVQRCSCLGLCERAPAALVGFEQFGPLTAGLPAGNARDQAGLRYARVLSGETRVLLAGLGVIDPESIESAIAQGAYEGLRRALVEGSSYILDQLDEAGVRGRGGAGFPTGRKWRAVANTTASPKYVVCNADESEPLLFKDRVLLESDPHLILEGMTLCGHAVGSEQGYIYIRGEYEPQARLLEHAIRQAEERGFLGGNILGSGFSFHVHVHRGAGAYICGEETALLESLEGKRGEPRLRPPFPTVAGLWRAPTVVNNVETFAVAPGLARRGADWYRALGSPATSGTKLYTVLGHVNQPGIFEAPYGLTLRQVVEEFGSGMRSGSTFQFALTGGAAGTIAPADLLDVPIDYDSWRQGVSLGAGGFLICDQSVSPLELLRELARFFERESCGKCTPCRVGTGQLSVLFERMVREGPRPGDYEVLRGLAETLRRDSFCGLGQSVALPLESALAHFGPSFGMAID